VPLSHAMDAFLVAVPLIATKKADAMEYPEVSHHVGLLTNSPPAWISIRPIGLRFI